MEQHFTLSDILSLTLYLGSITFSVGLVYQFFISIKTDNKLNFRQLFLVFTTRLLTITATVFIWLYWTIKIDIQFGPFLLPALFAELFLSPIFLKLFGYNIWSTKKAST